MRRRHRRWLNLIAFLILLVALYLNFFYKDKEAQAWDPGKGTLFR